MYKIKNYLSLIKFSHTIFAMPFAIIGFFLGIKNISPINFKFYSIKFLLVIFCMIFARSAAMAFNRWLDAKFDALNPRTNIREIPAGIIKSSNALIFICINCIFFFISTFFINRLCFLLSPIAIFIILFYSYTKRFTALCHLILGLGLSFAPIGAYIAVTGKFNFIPLLFSFAVLFWVSGFDIIYALQDEAFDKENNLHSIPSKLGINKAIIISIILHILSSSFVIYAGIVGKFNWMYWCGIVVFISLLIYQHLLIKPTDLSKINIAFFTTNGIASVIFALFVLLDLLLL